MSRTRRWLASHRGSRSSAPSLWPIGFAIGIAVLLVGMIVSVPVLIVGIVITLVFGVLYVSDYL